MAIMSNTLFNNRIGGNFPVEAVVCDSSAKTGTALPSGMGCCSLNKHHGVVKLSNIFKFAYKVITGDIKINAMYCEPFSEDIYTEISYDGSSYAATIGNYIRLYCDKDASSSWADQLGVVFAYGMASNNPRWKDFKESFLKIQEDITTLGKTSLQNAGLFCDSFYYGILDEWRDADKLTVPYGEAQTLEGIAQIGRAVGNPVSVDFGVSSKNFEFISFPNAHEEEKKPSALPRETVTERAIAGKYIIPTVWKPESEKKIPDISFLDLFISSPEYEEIVQLSSYTLNKVIERLDMGMTGKDAIGNDYLNLIMTGKPGTGKTTIAEALAASLHMPLYTVTTNKFAEEDEFQGKTKLGESSTGDGSSFKFCETPFLEGYKNGGVIVIEEFNLANPGMMMGAIGQAIEKPFVLMEDGYKPVQRHPLAIIIMTCNTMTQGAQEPNEALTSRAANVYNITDPNDDDFVKVLKTQADPAISKDVIKKVYRTFKAILENLDSTGERDIAQAITLRHCLAALRQIAAGVTFKRAIRNSMVNAIALKSPEVAEEVYDGIIEPMR